MKSFYQRKSSSSKEGVLNDMFNNFKSKMSLREYNFTANNINQKPSIIKQRSKMFYLFHLKSKYSASLSRSHYQSNVESEAENLDFK